MKGKPKNFFYRINPHEVLAATVFESDREKWLLNFFRELCEDNAETAQIPLAKRTILEAHGFREKRAMAGRASAEQRANKTQQPPTNVEQMLNNGQPVAVAVAVQKHKKENLKELSASGDAVLISRKKKVLSGKRLETFLQFWDAFDYKKSRAEAIDAWLEIPSLTNDMVARIVEAAKGEARVRADMISKGLTPKMAQGWISGRRWEDEGMQTSSDPLDEVFGKI